MTERPAAPKPSPGMFASVSSSDGAMSGDYLGHRSTRDGGCAWDWCRENGSSVAKGEFMAMVDSLKYTESGRLFRQEMMAKMKKARDGQLRFGEKEDVADIQRVPGLLELRFGSGTFDPSPELQEVPVTRGSKDEFAYRLYFAEPPEILNLLLGLSAGRKRASADGKSEQNYHIDLARNRYTFGKPTGWGIR